ncbi:hypothetical protein [Furfurilactobacillus milii]|uniref:Uncharacterized protein n=1 Tax=Furfurilactobacillus milii TaxID=2888272 RepID=A0A6N9I5P2_9LACO|nr:hypothetical protein [Furfurilactobacillus milii]MYV17623.1 hypothetical protein [Furfurilactobacillus milii]
MNESKDVLIITKKANMPLANKLSVELISMGYRSLIWNEEQFQKSSATAVPQRTIYLENSKPEKNMRDALNTVFQASGLTIKIQGPDAIIDVDQNNVNINNASEIESWYPKESLKAIHSFNEHDNSLHKALGKTGKSAAVLTAAIGLGASFAGPLGGILGASTGTLIGKVTKKDLIDDADVALVYLFVNFYAKDFMSASTDSQITYKTTEEIRHLLDKQKEASNA